MITAQERCYRLCQHSGAFGPWFHVSKYAKSEHGTWRLVEREGHYNLRQALALGYEFGHPGSAAPSRREQYLQYMERMQRMRSNIGNPLNHPER